MVSLLVLGMLRVVNRHFVIILFFVGLLLVPPCTFAQRGGEVSQFGRRINVPPGVAPSSVPDNTQLNLMEGGLTETKIQAGSRRRASSSVEINVTGGVVMGQTIGYGDTTINISDGTLYGGVYLNAPEANGPLSLGGSLSVTGGAIGAISVEVGTLDFGGDATAYSIHMHDSTATITGGSIGAGLSYTSTALGANRGDVQISGGAIGYRASTYGTNSVTLIGNDFELDGEPIVGISSEGSRFNLHDGKTLSGILANGDTFAFSSLDEDSLGNGSIVLQTAVIPPSDGNPISVPTDPVPLGLRRGQTLLLEPTGSIGNNFTALQGSELTINGGNVANSLQTVGGSVTLEGGSIGNLFSVFPDSNVTVNGGTVGKWLNALGGSEIGIHGGTIGENFRALPGSSVTISGGNVGHKFIAHDDSRVSIVGNEFRIDGQPVEGLDVGGSKLPIDVSQASSLTGVLADGTPFAFSPGTSVGVYDDYISPNTLTLVAAELPPIGAPSFNLPADQNIFPHGVRRDQVVTVSAAGVVPRQFTAGVGTVVHVDGGGTIESSFESVGARVNVSGGTIGDDFHAFETSRVVISAGEVGDRFNLYPRSTMDITNGNIGDEFQAHSGTTVRISGGTVGKQMHLHQGAEAHISGGSIGQRSSSGGTLEITGGEIGGGFRTHGDVDISGGEIGAGFTALTGSEVAISGGTFGHFYFSDFNAHSGSVVNILGTSFELNGVDFTDELELNTPFAIDERGSFDVLTGMLADQSEFRFDLIGRDSLINSHFDYFDPNATLTVTLVPARLICDSDGDGDCDLGDLDAMYAAFGTSGPFDFDGSGSVDAADVQGWLDAASDPANPTRPNGTIVKGDVNFDGKVDADDLGTLLNNFGDEASLGWSGGNLNGDAFVNSADLGELLNNFGHEPAALVAVPEPGSLTMLLVGAAVFIAQKRRLRRPDPLDCRI